MKQIFKNFIILGSIIFLSISIAISQEDNIRYEKFKRPFCMIGHGNPSLNFKTKVKIVKRYQRKIRKQKRYFLKNKFKENKGKLFGSPRWVVERYLSHRKFSNKEIQFAFFAMTLFGEARNLDSNSISMVARVINNRKKNRNYIKTVTELAQFSTWYYKNQRDNTYLLCPPKNQYRNWKKVVSVAKKLFNKKDNYLGATHYFSPYNMIPRYKIPKWSKGKHAVSYGGHIFLVDKNKYHGEKEIIYIPKNRIKIIARRGKIII